MEALLDTVKDLEAVFDHYCPFSVDEQTNRYDILPALFFGFYLRICEQFFCGERLVDRRALWRFQTEAVITRSLCQPRALNDALTRRKFSRDRVPALDGYRAFRDQLKISGALFGSHGNYGGESPRRRFGIA